MPRRERTQSRIGFCIDQLAVNGEFRDADGPRNHPELWE
ncbi:hypothetical protein A8924_6931 [Saccharopolyspora erythraea NRRL 2338]|nr:hypothetical protein A8924_6931 [Saccharopolyspora erythraea NRRL 2338]